MTQRLRPCWPALLARSTGPLYWPALLARLGRRAGLQQRDLLPDLAAQRRGEVLDVVDGLQHALVGEALHVERRDLADQRQHLAAVVEVAAELEAVERPLRRRRRARVRARHDVRI